MKKMVFVCVLCMVGSSGAFGAMIGNPASWDKLDLDFGNGTGKTSIASNFEVSWPTGGSINESLTADTSKITYGGSDHGVRTTATFGLGNNYTVEIAASVPAAATNFEFSGYVADGTSLDWRFRDGDNTLKNWDNTVITLPSGFNKANMNIYRIVCESGVLTLYLNNNPTPITGLTALPVGGIWGQFQFYAWAGTPSDIYEVDYLKVTSGAYVVPEPASMLLLFGGLGLAWRKRS